MPSRQILVPRKSAPRKPWVREQESRPCRRCGAEPGHQCVTASGTFAVRPHAERFIDAGGIPEPTRKNQRAYSASKKRKIRERIFAHYGTSCACCGTADNLTIDHINGDGKQHREEIGKDGNAFYVWLINNGFPGGFQVLCRPCNASKNDGDHCRIIHDSTCPTCPTCHRPLDEGVVLTLRRKRRWKRTDARDADILRLRDEEHLSWSEIATKVGLTKSGVRNRYRAIREDLDAAADVRRAG